ncbi:uncharacterized protein LOC121903875 isoform X2 [Thunnus maccoyii]|uniref:uncharacterized protein LOC121903875 isoform X2 n=1 Tax=Thunnus maccoyii TaxID=8240 RepID=UPI001C4D5343|nr:uncharacterized protein LOC121903875 isoform X2 [Thunnus maccoyii]
MGTAKKSFTVLISLMKEQICLFLLLCVPTLTQCFPVTAAQGGQNHMQLFFCETPGCATDVTRVFCNDKLVFNNTDIISCTDLPPPNTVCQHNGRAFISRDIASVCEFERANGYMETKECTDLSNICDLINAPTSSPISTKGQQNVREHHAKGGTIVGGVLCLVLIVSGLTAFFCSKKKDGDRNQQPESDSGVTLPLRNMQSSGETSERDTDCDPGLTDGSPPSQRDHGV